MTTPMTALSEDPIRAKVSILARLVPALSFMIASAGAVPSAIYMRNVLWAMREAETAGVAAVAGGIAESNLFVLIGLYLAIVCGLAGILALVVRLFMETKTVSPSSWFFIGCGVLSLLPAALVWMAESSLIRVVADRSGTMEVVSTINSLLIASMIAAPFSILLLLAGSVWPLSSPSKRKWSPLLALLAIELLLIIIAVAFQLRNSWLYQVKFLERFF